jgi:predicted nucleic acid-binding Zn ribbon protein
MPIYEYHCLDCGATFEKIVSLNIGVDHGTGSDGEWTNE